MATNSLKELDDMRRSYDDDRADWWKDSEPAEEPAQATGETKIAHYEERARRHWQNWKSYGNKIYLHHYKQANIKIRVLKQRALEGK